MPDLSPHASVAGRSCSRALRKRPGSDRRPVAALGCAELIEERAPDDENVFIGLWHARRMLPPPDESAKPYRLPLAPRKESPGQDRKGRRALLRGGLNSPTLRRCASPCLSFLPRPRWPSRNRPRQGARRPHGLPPTGGGPLPLAGSGSARTPGRQSVRSNGQFLP